MSALEKHEIQGNILLGYTYAQVAHLFFHIRDVHAARRLLGLLEVASATPWVPSTNRPTTTVTLGLSYEALRKLCHKSTGDRVSAEFSPHMLDELGKRYNAFKQGMHARGPILRDDLAEWEHDWARAELWITVHADSSADLEQRITGLRGMAGAGLPLVADLRGEAIVRNGTCYEHFGFQDNISNPEIEGAREPGQSAPALNLGSGKRNANGTYSPLRAGEFVLGYPNESGDALLDGALGAFMKNGTFAVFRKLEQHVSAFRDYLHAAAHKYHRSPEEIGALIVGRKQDGQPLTVDATDETANNFGYADDRDGARCPIASHTRRMHPRDASGVVEVSHRLLRRGMPYGPVLPEGEREDGKTKRGLFFVAVNADLERQFEFVQRRWLNAPTGSGLPDDYDPLVGAGEARMVVTAPAPSLPPTVIEGIPRFVTCRGGGYFFVPSLSAIGSLAEGNEAPSGDVQ